MAAAAKRVQIFDSTLRDGAQGEGVAFSVEDKLNIVRELDRFGVSYIEAGNPGSNPKDLEFFERVQNIRLQSAKLVAFGSTRRRDIAVDEDKNVVALLTANTPAVAIFGKSWDMHVTDIIHTTLEQNLLMIEETLRYFVDYGKEVLFDAEHFFDGYKANPAYALETLKAAERAGVSWLVLCDTNGGCFPDEIAAITAAVIAATNIPVGIHCHNDTGCAVAGSVAAVGVGASQVQGTFIGIGERCGNANLSTVIAGLQLKRGCDCVPDASMAQLTKTARYIAEIANVAIADGTPYVGKSAFAHKGGMHVDGVKKKSASFEHIPPESVGNERNVLLSEVSGRTAMLAKISEVDPGLTKDSPQTQELIDLLKELEFQGYQFEAATASFELVVLKHLRRFEPFFAIEHFKIITEHGDEDGQMQANAMIKVRVGDRYEMTAAEGDGPVNALDLALRKALEVFYPALGSVRLIDFKVRVMNTGAGTGATTRVLIESTDGESVWTTVGASTNIINASVTALVDSMAYKLLKSRERIRV